MLKNAPQNAPIKNAKHDIPEEIKNIKHSLIKWAKNEADTSCFVCGTRFRGATENYLQVIITLRSQANQNRFITNVS